MAIISNPFSAPETAPTPESAPAPQSNAAPEPQPAPETPPTAPAANTAPVVTESLKKFQEQLDRIEKLVACELTDERQKRNSLADKLADRQGKYETLMQNVQEDRYRKDKVKLVNKVIFFSDLIRRMLYDFNAHRDASQPKHEETLFLEQQFEKLIQTMDDALRHEMVVTRPMANQGDDFDEEKMEVIDTVETDDTDLAGKVFRSISACYIWQLPYVLKARLDEKGDEVRHYNFVLHPEEVIIYKLKKQ